MILVVESGFKMRKLFDMIFKEESVEYADNSSIMEVYRIKKPRMVIILSGNMEDVQIATLAKMMNYRTKIVWVSPSQCIKDGVMEYVDLFFAMPFNIDDFVLKINDLNGDYSR